MAAFYSERDGGSSPDVLLANVEFVFYLFCVSELSHWMCEFSYARENVFNMR